MQGAVLGLILSVVASLVVAVSFYWAVTNNETTNITTYTYETVNNREAMPVMMTQANAERWGTVPGKFESTLLESVNVMYYDNGFLNSKSIVEMQRKHEVEGVSAEELVDEHFSKLSASGSSLALWWERTVTPIFFTSADPTSELTYTPSVHNNLLNGTYAPTAEVPTINYEALNLWWQMQNLPTFMQAWQVFSQNTNKMY